MQSHECQVNGNTRWSVAHDAAWLSGRLWLVPRSLFITTLRFFSAALLPSQHWNQGFLLRLFLPRAETSPWAFWRPSLNESKALGPFLSTRNLWPNNCDEFLPVVFPLLGNRKLVMMLLLNTCTLVVISVRDGYAQQEFLWPTVFLGSY